MIHYYPWYINDWKSSETWLELGLMSKGLYRELIDACYQHGSVPTDESLLQKIAGCTRKEFTAAWPSVKLQFVEKEGRYYNSKVCSVLPRLQEKHEQTVLAGKASSNARRERSLNGRSNFVERALNEPQTTNNKPLVVPPVSPPPQAAGKPKPKRTTPAKPDPEREAWFDEWYAFYPRHEARQDAAKAFRRHVTSRDILCLAIDAIKERKGGLANGPGFLPFPATWLNRRPWEDEPPTQASLALVRPGVSGLTFHERNAQTRDELFDERMREEFERGPH